jgi:hypothetical protein
MAILTVVSAQNVETTPPATAGTTVTGNFTWVTPAEIVISPVEEARILFKAGKIELCLTILAVNSLDIVEYQKVGFNEKSLEKALLEFDDKTDLLVDKLSNQRKIVRSCSRATNNFFNYRKTDMHEKAMNDAINSAEYFTILLEVSRRYGISARARVEYNKLSDSSIPRQLTDDEMGKVFAPTPTVQVPKYHEPTPK